MPRSLSARDNKLEDTLLTLRACGRACVCARARVCVRACVRGRICILII